MFLPRRAIRGGFGRSHDNDGGFLVGLYGGTVDETTISDSVIYAPKNEPQNYSRYTND